MGYALCVFRGYALWYTNLPSTNLVEPQPHALLEVMHYKSDALREVLLYIQLRLWLWCPSHLSLSSSMSSAWDALQAIYVHTYYIHTYNERSDVCQHWRIRPGQLGSWTSRWAFSTMPVPAPVSTFRFQDRGQTPHDGVSVSVTTVE